MSTEIAAVPSVVKFQNGDSVLASEINEGEDTLNGIDSKNNSVRIIRKAKRFRRQSSGSDSQSSNGDIGLTNGDSINHLAVGKNSRQSRDARGRGLPKKGLHLRMCAFVTCFGMGGNILY